MKIHRKLLATGALASMFALSACGGDGGTAASDSAGPVAFIPKLTGVGFFESGGAGAVEAGDTYDLDVSYVGSPEASVAKQVELINSQVQQGASAVIVSSVSPDGLCQVLNKAKDQDVLVLTWDSDVNPECRSFYISQGTPDQLGNMLVDMGVEDVDKSESAKVAFHYASPTVTDQNQWAEVAKEVIAADTEWEVVDTIFSENQTEKAVQQAEALINANPDLKIIFCPDANALPGTAQAIENLGREDITVVGFSTPNVMRPFVENGTIKRFALWDVTKQGELSVAVAKKLLDGDSLSVGDKFDVDGLGEVEVSPNSVQGYDYEADGNGIIVMPERVVFTKDNIADYDF